jgi:uncharacterized protein YuzE
MSSLPSLTETAERKVVKMLVQYDTEAGATYVELSGAAVAGTVHISDLVMVDVDEAGAPRGIEFAVAPSQITDSMLHALADRFPDLKELALHTSWLYAPC